MVNVRLSRAELEALDRRATALGCSRSYLVRRLLTQGLAAEGARVTPSDPFGFAPAPELESWEAVAARLEFEHPQRWGPLPELEEE